MKKLIILNCFIFLTAGAISKTLTTTATAQRLDYLFGITIPQKQITLDNSKLTINYKYFLSVGDESSTEMRVTFNLLNANCYIFKVFHPKINQTIEATASTLKCEIEKSGVYMGYATICLKGQAVGDGATDLCKTIMTNINVH